MSDYLKRHFRREERGSRKGVGLEYLIHKFFERHLMDFHAYWKEGEGGVYAVFRAVSRVVK